MKSRVGLWPERLRLCAQDVGKFVLGRRLALFGPVGQCAFAHSFHLLECPREVWAAGRAPLLPRRGGADGGIKRGVAKSLCLRGNA